MKKKLLYIFLTIIVFFTFFSECFASEILENTQVTYESELGSPNIYDLNIASDCILMVEKETGDILYEKNAKAKMYPASTTKILTAILVLENCDLTETAKVSSIALKAVPPTYTTAALQVGEELKVEDLLYALLIPSANDAANVLAEHVAGSISGFADMMNEKAKELGCMDSHFTNPSGVHDKDLYTTAYDLSIMARYAMKFEKFREIVSTVHYTLPSTEAYPKEDRKFTISNALMNPSYKNYYYEHAIGIKTGYTNPAKDCLVAGAKKDDVEFIIVVLGDGYLENGLREKYLDCKTLFDFAFDNYTTKYKELQEKRQAEEQEKLRIIALEKEKQEKKLNKKTDSSFLRGLSKIIAVIAILLAVRFLFKKTKKKKNRYKFGKKRKTKKVKRKAKH
ncbi:MAG: D-alanyl-D-alanine carboxypeptidase [Clostridia bacterium]|nr:D-alanyl-D-alanine carboxypeptidase [Clostridia bacterium]